MTDAPAWLTDVPYAHRGLHGPGAPENTLAAFARAVEAGVGIELDVHATVDGHAVVLHDPDLTRTAGRALDVRRAPLDEVRAHPLTGSDLPVPTLAEVLELVAGRVPVMVEVKNLGRGVGVVEEATARVLDEHVAAPYSVASFHPGTVRWFALRRPGLVRGRTSGVLADAPLPAPVRAAMRRLVGVQRSRPHYLSYELAGLPNAAVSRLRAAGLPVITWTVRDRAGVERAREHADQCIFESLDPAEVTSRHG
ncbi:MAG: glycerophosphodiester phosphodiesterase family protein [Actinomycetes bacterium]